MKKTLVYGTATAVVVLSLGGCRILESQARPDDSQLVLQETTYYGEIADSSSKDKTGPAKDSSKDATDASGKDTDKVSDKNSESSSRQTTDGNVRGDAGISNVEDSGGDTSAHPNTDEDTNDDSVVGESEVVTTEPRPTEISTLYGPYVVSEPEPPLPDLYGPYVVGDTGTDV